MPFPFSSTHPRVLYWQQYVVLLLLLRCFCCSLPCPLHIHTHTYVWCLPYGFGQRWRCSCVSACVCVCVLTAFCFTGRTNATYYNLSTRCWHVGMCACRRACVWISSVVEQHRKLRTCHSVIVVQWVVWCACPKILSRCYCSSTTNTSQ